MKHVVCILTLTILLLGIPAAFTQDAKPAAPAAPDVAIKDTPASQSLVALQKKLAADQQAFTTAFQQARTTLDQNLKALNDELAKQQKVLHDQEASDKKYRPLLDKIDDLQKQIATAQETAQKKFNAEISTVQQNIGIEQAQIQALVPVVRRENDLPDGATFSIDTGKWTLPAKPAK
jgi:Skp family chaperone for outer membrane proteins